MVDYVIENNAFMLHEYIKNYLKGGIFIMAQNKEQGEIKLTRRTRDLIDEAIQRSQSTNRYEICQAITDILWELHASNETGDEVDKKLAYQSSRMKLGTTKKILEAVDYYFYKHVKFATKL